MVITRDQMRQGNPPQNAQPSANRTDPEGTANPNPKIEWKFFMNANGKLIKESRNLINANANLRIILETNLIEFSKIQLT